MTLNSIVANFQTFKLVWNTQAEVFDTGHGPFRALIASNLKWGGPCRATTCFRQADIKSPTFFYNRPIEGISYFPLTEALSGRDKVSPPHLTRETFSGRRPADGRYPWP